MPQYAYAGLLAGTVDVGATFTGVSVSGTLVIGASMYDGYLFTFYPNHSIHKLVGDGEAVGVSYEITVELAEDAPNDAIIAILPSGKIELTADDGQNG